MPDLLKNMIYMAVWVGGYDPPSYVVKRHRHELARTIAGWAQDMEEGVDTIDVLRIDLDTMTVEREENP